MEIAIGLPVAIPGAPGPVIVEWARRAEQAGFSSLGTIGRTVFDNHEELVALAAAAGATERIRLATTVLIGPTREPVLLAKQAATLDAISGGRFALGLGIGWRDDDFRATGTPFEKRGQRLEQQIDIMRRVWSGQGPADGLDAVGPRPSRSGGPPIWLGGQAPAALRRAGRVADGFLATALPPAVVRGMFDTAQAAREEAGRPGRLRFMGSGYFALDDEVEQGKHNLGAYYAAGGADFVKTMQDGLLTTADAIRQVLDGYREVGVEEVFLWPASCDPNQVEALAKIVQ